jgi:hypothetical protein
MAQQHINTGSAPDDGTGDPLRTAFGKCEGNFTELYAAIESGDPELIRDTIGAALVAGTGVSIVVNDAGDTITITNTAPSAGTYTDENARDAIGAALVAGSGISIAVNDGADTITIANTAAYTDEQAQDAVAAMIAAGTHTGLTVTYNDAGNAMSFTLSNGGLATANEWAPNFTAAGDVYIPAVVAMTIDQGNTQIGTGTLAFAKSTSAAPGTFTTTTLPATLQAGAWLKVSASAVSGFVATHLKRTA